MDFSVIAIKNNLLLFQDLSDEIIKAYIDFGEREQQKYLFSIFYSISSMDNYPNKTLNEIYDYALRNFKSFFKHMKHDYTEDDIKNFALLFTLINYHATSSEEYEIIKFIDTNFIKYDSNIEIIQWCQDRIELFKLQLYSWDVNNYRNGVITKMLHDLKDTANNFKEDLIYDIKTDSSNE